mgnify:CR=1 FL=1
MTVCSMKEAWEAADKMFPTDYQISETASQNAGYEKYTTAKLWNKEHAQIEIVEGIDKTHIAEYFRSQSQQCNKWIERYSWDFGENSRSVNDQKQYKAFYDSVVARLEGMA